MKFGQDDEIRNLSVIRFCLIAYWLILIRGLSWVDEENAHLIIIGSLIIVYCYKETYFMRIILGHSTQIHYLMLFRNEISSTMYISLKQNEVWISDEYLNERNIFQIGWNCAIDHQAKSLDFLKFGTWAFLAIFVHVIQCQRKFTFVWDTCSACKSEFYENICQNVRR